MIHVCMLQSSINKPNLLLTTSRDCSLTLVSDYMKKLFFEVVVLFSGHS